MRRLTTLFGIVAVWSLAAWLIGSFVAWNFNPGDWDVMGRAALAFLTFIWAGLSYATVSELL